MAEEAGLGLLNEEQARLADSRAQFVASLGRRLEAVRQALGALERAPRSAAHRDNLRRRVHAMGAAAGVLGFQSVFEAFREVESVLGRAAAAGKVAPGDLGEVSRTLDLVPSLVLGAQVSRGGGPEGPRPVFEPAAEGWPLCVLLFGAAPLAEALVTEASAGSTAIECARTEEAGRAEELMRVLAPDVAVVDSDRRGARELMETLANDPLLDPVQIIAIGSFDRPEAAATLVSLGVARVLPKPVSPDTLRRTVFEVARERLHPNVRAEPIGDVTVEALGDRIASEIRRGLVDAVKPLGRAVSVPLGEGTDVLAAVWSAVARVRELVTMRSGGSVRFDPSGPEGAIPLAPWSGEERQRFGSAARSSEGVELSGRRIVVADDDPAIVWYLTGLLKAAGAEVFEAHDGRQALALVQQHWPDLVVSDILMPELDGFSLCREIKRDIALSDLPVILLSWKEDLLQRVRELGAAADAYLRKEATASTVVQRVREVLRPRARVEARIAESGEARGRLDGLTPRLILQIVCGNRMSARVSVRDAAFLYEVEVRGGRLCEATRTAPDGQADRGSGVLVPLLGARAGRFVVKKDTSSCRRDFDGELADLLREPVRRARAAQRLLSGSSFFEVARVRIDERALGPYLEATPRAARAVVTRLSAGATPKDLLVTGQVSVHWVESVLSDLVMHGAVVSIVGEHGEDLLENELRQIAGAKVTPALPEFNTPPPSRAELVADSSEAADANPSLRSVEDEAPSGTPPPAPEPSAEAPAPPEEPSADAPPPVVEPTAEAEPSSILPEVRDVPRPASARHASAWGDALREAGVPPRSPEAPTLAAKEGSPLEQALLATPSPAGDASTETGTPGVVPESRQVEIEGDEPIDAAADTVAVPRLESQEPPPATESPSEPPAPEGAEDFLGLINESETAFGSTSGAISERPPKLSPYFSKPAPPTSAPRELSPLEEALKRVQADIPGVSTGSNEGKASAGWSIAIEEATGGSREPPRVIAKTPAPVHAPPRPGADSKPTAGDPRPKELELGSAVIQVLEGGDEDSVPVGDRVTMKPEERVTTRPPGPNTPPAEAHRSEPPPPDTPPESEKRRADQERKPESEPPKAGERDVEKAGASTPSDEDEPDPLIEVFASRDSEPPEELFADEPAEPIIHPWADGARQKDTKPSELDARAESPLEGGDSPPAVEASGDGNSPAASVAARESAPPRSPTSAPTQERQPSPATPPGAPSRWPGALGAVVLMTAAGAVSFVGVNALRERFTDTASPIASAGAPAAVATALAPAEGQPTASAVAEEDLSSPTAPEPTGPALVAQPNLDLPPDLAVGADKGLLDIDTGATHSIYVDDVFVGRGPLRRVPLRAGEHQVRLRLEGEEHTYRVGIQAGRRTRLAAAGAP